MPSERWDKKKQETFDKAWAKIIAKAWSDPAFKQRLLKDPISVFKENGMEFSSEVELKVNENTSKIVYLSLPNKPLGEMTEESLKRIGGGNCNNSTYPPG